MKPVATLAVDEIVNLVEPVQMGTVSIIKERFYLCHLTNNSLAQCARSAYQNQYKAWPKKDKVAQDEINGVQIITRLTGIDLRALPDYPIKCENENPDLPVVFETVYDGEIVGHFQSWTDAEAGHKAFVKSFTKE
jgi:hypothetical protein